MNAILQTLSLFIRITLSYTYYFTQEKLTQQNIIQEKQRFLVIKQPIFVIIIIRSCVIFIITVILALITIKLERLIRVYQETWS